MSSTTTTADPPPDAMLLTCPQVARMLQCSQRSVHAWSASGRMPAPIHIGKSSSRWRRSELERFIERKEER